MADPVVCSVRLSGSCEEWLPVVRDSLISRGYQGVAVDPAALRLSGECDGFFQTVTLAPVGNETVAEVCVTSNVDEVHKIVDKEDL